MAKAVTYTLVATGTTVSEIVATAANDGVGVSIPNSLDLAVFVQGSWDQTDANFARLQDPFNGGDFSVNSNSVHIAADLTQIAGTFPYIRIETGAATTLPMTFAVIENKR